MERKEDGSFAFTPYLTLSLFFLLTRSLHDPNNLNALNRLRNMYLPSSKSVACRCAGKSIEEANFDPI